MKILIAEDESDILMQYELALRDRNHDVVVTHDGEQCLDEFYKELEHQESSRKSKISRPPFDAVVLDYRMPKKDGMEVAKEILAEYPHQRIIFASAYVRESLQDMVKQLKQVVELLQKPFEPGSLVDTIEDKEIYEGLEKLNADIELIKDLKATHEQLSDLLEGLRKLQKGRTF